MKKLRYQIISVFISIIIVFSCNSNKKRIYRFYEGPIQGTYFHITYEWYEDLSDKIDSLLLSFNKSLSNYDSTSLISKINNNKSDVVDDLFKKMFIKSKEVYEITNGAFDITVAPIANLWGFGWIPQNDSLVPDSALINSLIGFVGMDKVSISLDGKIVKKFPEIQFISNAIAQGLSVDYLAEYFIKKGLENFIIEIGGELYAYGKSSRGDLWRVGIDKPIEGSNYSNRENQIIIEVSNKGVATSGNYRKFITSGSKKLGHSLNPKTGYPSENSLLSVTVIADDCMTADAFATAFMVLGLERSLQIVDSIEDMEAYFIFRDNNNKDRAIYSKGFQKYIIE